MQNIQQISIPTPCHQSWQDMTPANKGRHCTQCSKIVTDFTKMTDSQIITYLGTANNICGRIDQQQLGAINQQLLVEDVPLSGGFKSWILAIGLLGSMSFFKAEAQTKPATEQAVIKPDVDCNRPMLGQIGIVNPIRVIKGVVLDEINQPIPGVLIIANQYISTQTDVSGKFGFTLPPGVQQFKISAIGFATQIITTNDTTSFYQIKLKEVQQMLGEVVITKRPSLMKRTYNRYIRRPIHKLFKALSASAKTPSFKE